MKNQNENILAIKLRESYSKVEKHLNLYGAVFCLLNLSIIGLKLKNVRYIDHVNIPLHSLGIILGLVLILAHNSFRQCREALAFYWHLALIYFLPFSFSYFFLMNQKTSLAQLTIVLVMAWLSLLVKAELIAPMAIIGCFAGYVLFSVHSQEALFFPDIWVIIIYCIIIVVNFAIFDRKKEELIEKEKASLKLLSGSIAHELRTPLMAVSGGAHAIQRNYKKLMDGYCLAKESGLNVERIPKAQLESLREMPQSLENISDNALSVIDILLVNLRGQVSYDFFRCNSINECIKKALDEYPFVDNEEKLISWKQGEDFMFWGDGVLLKHVLFNLIKNSLYFVKKSRKGNIEIFTSGGIKNNILHFRDTATGISSDILPYVFERFYTKTSIGSGIGLAFCKEVIEGFGGKLSCESQEGEYTEFFVQLPNINKQKKQYYE